MDFKTIKAVINANADKSLSASARLVIVALAVGMFKEGSQCKATVKELSRMCNISPRTVKSVIATLKKAGIVGVAADGTANVYTVNGATIAPLDGGEGATIAPIGATIAPLDGGKGATIAPIGATIAPLDGGYKVLEYKKDLERVREAPTHTSKSFDELTDSDAVAAGRNAGITQGVARQVFAEMKANGGGYMSRGVFVKVTDENLQAAIRTMSNHVKPEAQTAKPKARTHTADEIKSAKALCAERCARFCNGQCGAGVSVFPSLSDYPRPPEECKNYKAKQ